MLWRGTNDETINLDVLTPRSVGASPILWAEKSSSSLPSLNLLVRLVVKSPCKSCFDLFIFY